MSDRTAFGPFELDTMAAAFELALEEASDASKATEHDGYGLRRRLAAGIVAAAKDGVTDIEDLASEGMRALYNEPRQPIPISN